MQTISVPQLDAECTLKLSVISSKTLKSADSQLLYDDEVQAQQSVQAESPSLANSENEEHGVDVLKISKQASYLESVHFSSDGGGSPSELGNIVIFNQLEMMQQHSADYSLNIEGKHARGDTLTVSEDAVHSEQAAEKEAMDWSEGRLH